MEKKANVVLRKLTNTTMFLMGNRKKVPLIIYKTEKGKKKEERNKDKKKREEKRECNTKMRNRREKKKSERGIDDKGKRK